MGSHLRVLSESYPMNTNMTGLRWFVGRCVHVLWAKIASALEGLMPKAISKLIRYRSV